MKHGFEYNSGQSGRRCTMKKITYVKPLVVGTASVHPC